jgi:hypothetical protein
MEPTEEEVQEAVAQVWLTVAELMAVPGGELLMRLERRGYPEHDA